MNYSGFSRVPLVTDQIITADFMDVMLLIPDGSIDLILTDMPYGIGYQSNRRKVKDKFAKMESDTIAELRALLQMFFFKAFDVLKRGSHLYAFCRWDTYPLFLEKARSQGFTVKNCLVWVKDNHGSGDLFGAYAPRHEFCLFCVKPGETTQILRGKRTDDVMFYPKVPSPKLLHPTQKPLRMLTHLIERSSEPGDVVLDPFCGSGSTCKAAKLLGRRFIGVEIDRSIAATARQNLGGLE
jgi:DNA modification methylase